MSRENIDLCGADSYAGYLADLEKRNPSVAQEDIYSDFGVLLVPKGTVVSPSIVLKLSEHRMQAPLDDLVSLQTRLNSKSLFRCFQQLLEKDSDLEMLVETTQFSPLLRHLCLQKEMPFSAMQKLTVIAYRLPDLFQRTLGVTLLACMTAKKLGWDNQSVQDVFEASMFRDIGLLHLMPADELIERSTTEQNHEDLQFHGSVSEKILRLENRYTEAVLEAVRDHHERRDGSGFPRAHVGDAVSELALLISVMDGIWLARTRQASTRSFNLGNLAPLLKTNSYGANSAPYSALLALILSAGLKGDPLPKGIDQVAMSTFLLDRNLIISQLYTHLMQLDSTLNDEVNDQTLRVLVSSNIELIRSCGFGNFETMALLTEQNPDMRYTHDELLELDLSQTELFWRISRLINLLGKRCSEKGTLGKNPEIRQTLREMESITEDADPRSYLESLAEQQTQDVNTAS